MKLSSVGMITDGTERTPDFDSRNHRSPIVAKAEGAGYVRQSVGRSATLTDSIAMLVAVSTEIATRSAGSRSESVLTNRSSAASDSLADTKMAGSPLGSSDSHNDAPLHRRASHAPHWRSARHALADNPVLDSSKDVFDLTGTDIGPTHGNSNDGFAVVALSRRRREYGRGRARYRCHDGLRPHGRAERPHPCDRDAVRTPYGTRRCFECTASSSH
jgi:hypothetical protein